MAPCDIDLACVRDAPASGICRRYCDPDSPGTRCASPAICQRLAVLDGHDIPRTLGLCFPDTRYMDACDVDQSCDAGQVCSVGAEGAHPDRLSNICDWPVGTAQGLAPCTSGDQCRSGLCLGPGPLSMSPQGFCELACVSDSQCPTANNMPGACADFGLQWPDGAGRPAVNPVPSCAVQCNGQFDCADTDACRVFPNHARTAFVSGCGPGNTQAPYKFGGAPCATGDECWSGLCWTFGSTTDGFCEGACDRSSGAGCDPTTVDALPAAICPADGVMRWLGPGPDGRNGTADDVLAAASMCWPRSCTHDVDCSGLSLDPAKPRVCAPDPDPTDDSNLLLHCHPRVGNAQGGGVCASDEDCASGWCVNWRTQDGSRTAKRCFGACQSNAECASTATDPTNCDTAFQLSPGAPPVGICLPLL